MCVLPRQKADFYSIETVPVLCQSSVCDLFGNSATNSTRDNYRCLGNENSVTATRRMDGWNESEAMSERNAVCLRVCVCIRVRMWREKIGGHCSLYCLPVCSGYVCV